MKNRQKQNIKAVQKKKKRQEKIKKQNLSKQAISLPNVEDMVDRALQLVEKGDYKEGKRILDKVKKKHGRHSHVYYGLGVLAALDDNHDKAIQCFKKATQISPDFIDAHYNLGVAYQKQIKIPEMVTTFRKVVEFGESDSNLFQHAQDMLNRIGQQVQNSDGISLDEYIRGYQIFEQGVQYMESKNYKAAIIEFEKTTKITPSHTQSYGNLGICYASIGRKQDALDALDQAIKLDPNYEPALLNREFVLALEEGECLEKDIKVINYYKDYPLANKSYIKEYADSQGLLTEK